MLQDRSFLSTSIPNLGVDAQTCVGQLQDFGALCGHYREPRILLVRSFTCLRDIYDARRLCAVQLKTRRGGLLMHRGISFIKQVSEELG